MAKSGRAKPRRVKPGTVEDTAAALVRQGDDAPKVVDSVLWAVDRIEPNPWNPYKMSPEKFEALVESIRTGGFDEPLQVIKHPDPAKAAEWVMIIGGEHRWRAARVVGMPQIPVVVKPWDVQTAKLMTIHRNAVRGSLDPVKFTHLVNGMLADKKYDPEELRRRMGMVNPKEFQAAYIAVKDERDKAAKEAITDGQRKVRAVHDIGTIVRKLMEQFGDTVPSSYMFFMYGGQEHLMVEMVGSVRQFVDMVVAQTKAEGRDVNAVFLEWIGGGDKA